MRYRFLIFIFILLLFMTYTGFKVTPFFPKQLALGWLLNILFFVVMLGWWFGYHFGIYQTGSVILPVLAWTGSFFMGLWATFIIFSIPFDVTYLGLVSFRKLGLHIPFDTSTTQLFRRSIPSALAIISLGMALWGLREALTGPIVKEINIPIHNLPGDLSSLRIVQISDLHISPTHRQSSVKEIVRQVMDLKPDLIALTGDVPDGPAPTLAGDIAPLSELKAPYGKFFVTGNHEYYWGVEEWIQKMNELGFTVLLNENKIVPVGKARLLVGGVTDIYAHHFVESQKSDPVKAAASGEASDVKLLLAHQPKSCFAAEKAGFQLQLSGHTHSGQFFPFNLLVPFFQPYSNGLHQVGAMWLYVNVGTGYWGPPNRLAIPSEITLIRLQKA